MKIFKSIKWRLQIWYGLILVGVLAGFVFAAYQLERSKVFRQTDDELIRRSTAIAAAFHRPPPRPGEPSRPPLAAPPPEQFPAGSPPSPDFGPPTKFVLPAQLSGLFDPSDPRGFYYIINGRDGHELARSTNAPKVVVGWDSRSPDTVARLGPDFFHSISVQTLGRFRQVTQTLPAGETIQVGGLIAPALQELHRAAISLATTGVVVLLLGLAGGGWISSRAIRPVENISATALKISAGDLSQRINVAETESELGQLASVLNATFARLESAFAQQKQFASDAAHELRTPVAVILTQTQAALAREREARDYKQTLEACQRAAQRMRKLIGALLELARLDAGQEPMKRQRFDFSKMAAECVELTRPLADERGVNVVAELSPLEITGDAERLGQVATNLLANAIEYNHDGGQVTVTTKADNGMAVLTVSDTGQGIPPEDLPRVFERFYRADKSRSSGNGGLGLAISQAIVAAHGGNMDVTSKEHAGTTFTVRLPL